MIDDERPDDVTPDEPAAEEPSAEEVPADESVAAEEAPAEEAPAEEPVAEEPVAEEAPAEEPVAGEAPAEEAPPEEVPAEEPVAAEEPAAETVAEEVPAEEPAAEADAAPAERKRRGGEDSPAGEEPKLPPGAELEPITLEPERQLSAEERAREEAEAEERARREAEATAEISEEEPLARRGPRVELPADAMVQATGKRKSSIARVVVRSGGGSITVNRRELAEYFPREHHQSIARQALVAAGYEDGLDVRVRVQGGGISGQADAVRHGIAKALTEIDPELRGELKRRGLLTRDARRKERRKAGLKKARKRPQFSKR